jgi:hypothetical protein
MVEERLCHHVGAPVIQPDEMVSTGQLRARHGRQELTRTRAAPPLLEPGHRRIQPVDQPHPASQLSDREQPSRTRQRRIRRADPEQHPTPTAGP